MPRSAPSRSPRSMTSDRSGRRSKAASWRSLRRYAARSWTSPLVDRREQVVGVRRLGVGVRVELVEVAVDGRRGHALGVDHGDPPPGRVVAHRARPARRGRVPRAVPPISANGTSLPSSAAIRSRSSSEVSTPHSRSSATSAAAASAEPPAMPPAIGIDLAMLTSAFGSMPWWSASSRAARSTMLSPVTGTRSASIQSGTDDPEAPAGRRRRGDVVADPDRLVDGEQRVEAVLARRADAEVEVDLRGRADRERHAVRSSASAIRANAAHVQHLAAGGRVDARRGQGGLDGGGVAGHRAERRAQRLAALGERRVDDGEHLLAGRGGRRRVPAGPGDQPGVDVGDRPEDAARDVADAAYVGVPGGLHRRHAVGARARRGGQPVGDLGLHHHQAPLQRRQQREQVQEDRDRDVVGQVGDHARWAAARPAR